MANAVTVFEVEMTKTSLTADQRLLEVKPLSDQLCRDLWVHFCDHQIKHLDAIALANPTPTVQQRVDVLKQVIEQMKLNGMPDVALLEVL